MKDIFEKVRSAVKFLTIGYELESLPFPRDDEEFSDKVHRLNYHVHRDNSVHAELGGQEFVSPVLDTAYVMDGLLYRDLQTLLPYVETTTRAGLHVHIGFAFLRDYEGDEEVLKLMRHVLTLWATHENFFVDDYASRLLSRRKWCRKILFEDHVESMRNALKSMNHLRRYSGTRANRYHTLNLCSYFEHGTVEFRTFNSTFSAREVIDAISLCLAIVGYSYAYMQYGEEFPSVFADLDQFKDFWAHTQELVNMEPEVSEQLKTIRQAQLWA